MARRTWLRNNIELLESRITPAELFLSGNTVSQLQAPVAL